VSDRKWVCDASPIILLAKVGRADLLLSLSDALMNAGLQASDSLLEDVLRRAEELE
jgi:predicted nucleic acid-binding protein